MNTNRPETDRAKSGKTPAERKQTTPQGTEIPVPTRGEFDSLVRKVAGRPAGRKRPAETDPPHGQSFTFSSGAATSGLT